jgi:SAM-dependent methyltransferase
LPYPDESFDRLIATCLLLHLAEPYIALREWRRVVRPGGALDILIPCDPGLAVRSFRRFVTSRRARKFGCDNFGLVNAIEHRNHIYGLLQICAHVFRDDTVARAWRPLPGIPAWNLNTHMFLRVTRA